MPIILVKKGQVKLIILFIFLIIFSVGFIVVTALAITYKRKSEECYKYYPICDLRWTCNGELDEAKRCPAVTLKSKIQACLDGDTVNCNAEFN